VLVSDFMEGFILVQNDFTAESQRTQRKTFFRIPEREILKKLTSIENASLFLPAQSRWVSLPSGKGLLDSLFPLLRGKDYKQNSASSAPQESEANGW